MRPTQPFIKTVGSPATPTVLADVHEIVADSHHGSHASAKEFEHPIASTASWAGSNRCLPRLFKLVCGDFVVRSKAEYVRRLVHQSGTQLGVVVSPRVEPSVSVSFDLTQRLTTIELEVHDAWPETNLVVRLPLEVAKIHA